MTQSEFEELQRKKKSFVMDGERYWVVEGDLLFDAQQLREWAEGCPNTRDGLVAMDFGQGVQRWSPGTVLTYFVRRDTFGDHVKEYDETVERMAIASQQWMEICGCRFQHLQNLDTTPSASLDDAVFYVKRVRGERDVIATAFFPYYAKHRRFVALHDGFFEPNPFYEPVGALRHELGHVLGFRHEHIRSGAPAVCNNEDLDHTIDLTNYDPNSVMHYYCGGVGDPNLGFTDEDRVGAVRLYGPPFHRFDFVQP